MSEANLTVTTTAPVVSDLGLAIVRHMSSVVEAVAQNNAASQCQQLVTPEQLALNKDLFWKGEALTTGDHMSDCLAVWYGPELDDKTTATFHALNARVRASIGELAMVVLRREEHGRHGSIVGVQYQIGRLVGDAGLYMELRGAQVKLPTQESYRAVTLPSGKPGLAEMPSTHPMIVHRMLDLASRQQHPPLPFNSVDLINHQDGPTIDPQTRIDPDHVSEAAKPPLEIIFGTSNVKDFLSADLALQRHGSAMGLPIASFLLRNFQD